MNRGYGCIQDDTDHLDRLFRVERNGLVLPDSHDLTPWFPAPLDQGPYGTCTAHGVTAALRYNFINDDQPDVVLSRSQPYWDAGVLEGNTEDVGRQIRDMVKTIAQKGVVPETVWGYDKVGQAPPPEVYSQVLHVAVEYNRVLNDRFAINAALFVGHPVIIGVPVYQTFESEEVAATGLVPMPGPGDTEVGLHCMLMGGYTPEYDIVLNSWGPAWGLGGYCRLPRGYLEKYGSDMWTITASN